MHSAPEMALVCRLLITRSVARGESVWLSQIDWAAAYDSVPHPLLAPSMLKRGMELAEVFWYIRELRGSLLVLRHRPWQTFGIRPLRRLKQGCSCSPILFRWVLEDVIQDGQSHLSHLVWADDTTLLAGSPDMLEYMVASLEHQGSTAGALFMRPHKCRLACFGARVCGPLPEKLGGMSEVSGCFESEWQSKRAKAWAAFHLRRPFWLVRNIAHVPTMRMMHTSIWPTLSWCAGLRHGTSSELAWARSLQLRMTRRILK